MKKWSWARSGPIAGEQGSGGGGPHTQAGLKQKCFFWEKLSNFKQLLLSYHVRMGKNILLAGVDCSLFFTMRAFKHISYPPQDIVQTTGSQESIGCGGKQGRVAREMLSLLMRLIHPVLWGLWSQKVGFNRSQPTLWQ